MSRLRIGVVGCGAIAQAMHLPYLREMDDRFELVAVCDRDRDVLAAVAERHNVDRRHVEPSELLREPLDAVLIASSGDHAPLVEAALRTGRHVLCEKPLAYTVEETDALIAAAERAGRVLMVGFMKRYDPGYRRGAELVRELADLRLVEAHVLHPAQEPYLAHHDLLPRRPRPADLSSPREAAAAILAREPLDELAALAGSHDPAVLVATSYLLASAIHDIDALGAILGQPERVVAATAWANGTSLSATLAWKGDVRGTYSWSLLPELRNYEETLAFAAPAGRVRIRFPSPYLRHEPTLVEVESMNGQQAQAIAITTSYAEAFREELAAFADAVQDGSPPLTDGRGFRDDLLTVGAIARAIAADRGGSPFGVEPGALWGATADAPGGRRAR